MKIMANIFFLAFIILIICTIAINNNKELKLNMKSALGNQIVQVSENMEMTIFF